MRMMTWHFLRHDHGDLLAGAGGVRLAAGRRLYLSLGYHGLGVLQLRGRGRGRGVRGGGTGLDQQLHVGVVAEGLCAVVGVVEDPVGSMWMMSKTPIQTWHKDQIEI